MRLLVKFSTKIPHENRIHFKLNITKLYSNNNLHVDPKLNLYIINKLKNTT